MRYDQLVTDFALYIACMTPIAAVLSGWAWWLAHQPRCPHWFRPAAWALFATWSMAAVAMFVGRHRMVESLDTRPMYRASALGAGIKIAVNATALAAGALVAATVVIVGVAIWMRSHRMTALRSYGSASQR